MEEENANPRLTAEQILAIFNPFLREIRERLIALSNGDDSLLFALRRKLYKEMSYDERNKPMHRKMLKMKKHIQQNGICPLCGEKLPEKYAVLDRLQAIKGYTEENTRLIHADCDYKNQTDKNYS